MCLVLNISLSDTVKPLHSSYLQFLKKVSAITSCLLYEGLKFFAENVYEPKLNVESV